MARDRGGPALARQLLLYPVLAADFDTESYRLFGRGYYNPKPAMQWYWDQYVPTKAPTALIRTPRRAMPTWMVCRPPCW